MDLWDGDKKGRGRERERERERDWEEGANGLLEDLLNGYMGRRWRSRMEREKDNLDKEKEEKDVAVMGVGE